MTNLDKQKLGDSQKITCRILLLFSEDGTEYASQAVDLARTVEHEVIQHLILFFTTVMVLCYYSVASHSVAILIYFLLSSGGNLRYVAFK